LTSNRKKKKNEKPLGRFFDLLRHSVLQKIILGIGFVCILTLLFPGKKAYEFSELKVGDISEREIIAPFTFAIEKNDADLREERRAARKNVPPVITYNEQITTQRISQLDSFFTRTQELLISEGSDSTKLEIITGWNLGFTEESLHLLVFHDRHDKRDEPDAAQETTLLSPAERLVMLQNPCRTILWEAYNRGMVRNIQDIKPESPGHITIVRNEDETLVSLENLVDVEMVKANIIQTLSSIFPDDNKMVRLGYEISMAFLMTNLLFDEVETDLRRHEAEASVQTTKGLILEGQRIIDSHVIVTQSHVDAITSFIIEKEAQEPLQSLSKRILPVVGRIAIICLLVSMFALYLRIYRPKIFASNTLLLAIGLILLLVVTAASFIFKSASLSDYLIPVTIGAMLLTILFDAELSIMGTVIMSLLVASLWRYEFTVGLVALFAGITATFCVARVRHRHDFYKPMLYVPLTYIISITALNLLRFAPPIKILTDCGFGIANGILAPILTIGLLPIFETLFHMTTDITLLELSDLNRPLLRKLSLEAPGSYNHSLLVGDLAEAACDAIGANSLLARAGAYYHDIGKLAKPKYFGENLDYRDRNPHDRLSPSMSSLILASHVKEGIDLAKKYKLPHVIRDFISQHHGTSLMIPFYKKALEQGGEITPDESKFRYAGPKPQSREVGVLMLADSVHAAVISLKKKDKTPRRIKVMVNTIFENKFSDGQLNESDLTLRDLAIIEESFLKKIRGMLHEREEYPDQKTPLPKPRENTLPVISSSPQN